MKKLLIVIGVICSALFTAAGQENSIYLDQSSFESLSADGLTNLAVDKIQNDRSNRPCARLKIRMDRMTPDEIKETDVILIGGNVMITNRYNAALGNGIIVEMTAKNNIRFYLKHPTIGSSNTVSVSMEGNKEYQINAFGNRSHSITIACDRVGAEVYVNEAYHGEISSTKMITVPNVRSGSHKVKIMDGNDLAEETINVSSDQVYFPIALKNSASLQKYVVFEVIPDNAIIELDGTVIPLKEGKAHKSLRYGTHSYSITAPKHHGTTGSINIAESTQEPHIIKINLPKAYGYLEIGASASGADVYVDGEPAGQAPLRMELSSGTHDIKLIKAMHKPYSQNITIEDDKTVKMIPELVANYAEVTISVEKDADIWIDMEKMGKGRWTGKLGYGLYTIEVRKEGYKNTRISHEVTSDRSTHNLTVSELEPVIGSLVIESDPVLADIYIDGVNIGKSPKRAEVLAGTRQVRISQEGYEDYTTSVNIREGKEENITAIMKKRTAKKKPVMKPDTENMFQMGFGFESSYTKHNQFAFPIDLRIGSNDEIFNLFIGEAIGWDSATPGNSKLSSSCKFDSGSVTYLATYIQGRFNFMRSSTLRIFTYIGGNLYFNINGSLKYTAASSSANYSTYTTYNTVNITPATNTVNYSGRIGFGFGGRVMELSIYCDYLFGEHFDMKYLSEEREYRETWKSEFYQYDHEKGELTKTYNNLINDGAAIWDNFGYPLSFGFSIKFYLFTGWEF